MPSKLDIDNMFEKYLNTYIRDFSKKGGEAEEAAREMIDEGFDPYEDDDFFTDGWYDFMNNFIDSAAINIVEHSPSLVWKSLCRNHFLEDLLVYAYNDDVANIISTMFNKPFSHCEEYNISQQELIDAMYELIKAYARADGSWFDDLETAIAEAILDKYDQLA